MASVLKLLEIEAKVGEQVNSQSVRGKYKCLEAKQQRKIWYLESLFTKRSRPTIINH